jgi:TRAP-type C4-dicarboxylate transport system permease small subunit
MTGEATSGERSGPGGAPGPGAAATGPLPAAVERVLTGLGGLLILGLTGLTTADVVLRYWFNAPITGAFELTEVMLAALIFAALPLTTNRDLHVTVDVVDAALPPGGRRLLRVTGDLVAAGALGVFAWRLAVQALRLGAEGTTTFSLAVPMAPLAWFACAACALSALVALARAWRIARGG